MYAPGVVGIVVGLLILIIMKDSPESVGYPPIEPKKAPKGAPPPALYRMCALPLECICASLATAGHSCLCARPSVCASRPACWLLVSGRLR